MLISKLLSFASLAISSSTCTDILQRDTKPTIVISPGAWQLEPSWANFRQIITSKGYDHVYVPHLSVGAMEKPRPGLTQDVANLRAQITALVDEGKEVVLFGHSYGGAVIGSAVEDLDIKSRKQAGKPGGVLLTAFMAAFALPESGSILDLLPGHSFLPWMQEDIVFLNTTDVAKTAFNGLSKDEQEYYSRFFTWTSAAAFTEPATYAPWEHRIPAAYIHAFFDQAIPYIFQTQFVDQMQKTTEVASYYTWTGHCPWIADPEETFGLWEQIVEVAQSSFNHETGDWNVRSGEDEDEKC